MDFDQLTYFYKIVKNHSITKAAKELFMTPAALSTSLKNLERELGYTLVERTHNGVSLTYRGSLFFADVEKILDMRRNWMLLSQNTTLSTENDIQITMVPVVYHSVMSPILLNLLNIAPHLQPFVHEANVADIEQSLYDGSCSIALTAINPENYSALSVLLDNLGLGSSFLYMDEFVVYLNPTHPLASMDQIPSRELYQYTGLAMAFQSTFFRFKFLSLYNSATTLYFHNQQILLDKLATSNDCFTVLPKILTRSSHCLHKEISWRPLADVQFPHEYVLIYSPDEKISAAEKVVVTTIKDYFSTLSL